MSTDHSDPAGERPALPGAGGDSEHANHDELLISRLVGGDVTPEERERAAALLESCGACRILAADLVAISRAVTAMPAPRRTREFRLTPEQAARLAPGGVRGWLARLGSPSIGPRRGWLGTLQPAAAAVVAIGLVMALVTSPVGLLATGGSSTAGEGGHALQAGALPSVAASAAPARAGAEVMPGASVAAMPAASAAAGGSGFGAGGTGTGQAGSPEPGMLGATGCGPAASASKDTAVCAPPSEAPVAVALPPASPSGAETPQTSLFSRAPAASSSIEAWQLWLVLAAAAAVAFAAIRLALRRAE